MAIKQLPLIPSQNKKPMNPNFEFWQTQTQMFHSKPRNQISFSYFLHQTDTEPPLHPPGTDPYANLDPSYCAYYVGVEFQSQYHRHPDEISQSWVVGQAHPARYDAASSNSTALNSTATDNSTTRASVNYAPGNLPNRVEIIQPIHCEVCNTTCNSKDVFQKHVLGKKHKKNLLEKSSVGMHMSFPEHIGGVAGGTLFEALSSDLESKRQKLLSGGATSDSVRVCAICNVVCNSLEVFTKHLTGKRHAAQAALVASGGAGPYIALARAKGSVSTQKVKKPKFVKPLWCDVCKVSCSSHEVYTKHLSGKKHKKNMEIKSGKSENKLVGWNENPEEDVEEKKRKVIEGGAEADHVRVCDLCNVVCNSQRVFDSHLSGKKHAAMLKKQTEANAGNFIALPQPH